MRFRNIFWGVVLILLGVLFVLKNLGVIDFSWSEVWHFWPILFILWGVSILPLNDYIKLALFLVVVAGAFYFIQNPDYRRSIEPDRFHHDRYYEDEDSGSLSYKDQEFSTPWDESITQAKLRFEGGAGDFNIDGSTDELVALHARGKATYSLESDVSDGISDVYITMREHRASSKQNQMDISLNQKPVWDLEIDCGAANLKADLRDFKVRSVDLDGGAASLNIALGNAYPEAKLSIDAGASDLKIMVPQDSDCEIKLSTVLTDKTLPGFIKSGTGTYRSVGYGKAGNKIFIQVNAAVANLEIERY